MKKTSKNNAYILMKFKITDLPHERLLSLGLMTMEQVRTELMVGQFSAEAVAFSVNELAMEGNLDVYYDHQCVCRRYVPPVREEDYETRKTLLSYREGHRFCIRCGKEVDLVGATQLYAIPNDVLQKAKIRHSTNNSMIQRIRNWLTRERNI